MLFEAKDGIAVITLNRPHRRNALTNPQMQRLGEMITAASSQPELRAILLTGAADKAFCAGADLTPGDTPFKPDFSRMHTPFAEFLRAGKNSALPIIGRINGDCMAGGMGLLGVCDIAIAAEHARFALSEVKIGLFPMQVVAVLRDMMPRRVLADLSYTGRFMAAAEAQALGLVNRVVPAAELDQAVDAVLADIRRASPAALRRGRYALRAMESMSFDEMIAFAETQVGPMILTDDAREGLEAFNQKRKPSWAV
ncbi:enoyl-CoA hydratase/isomerase family protein [Verticiella sediminum]|uniref:Enoyl-CoA hydratase/isomerase family protein n=1 Tax=Verticiella sediminum TaxID=1247510 RepID=A0A556B274_9BURK|nr:enoyl-CoA hydratase/isomerase family protein [Verticiella sediminum]